MILPGNALHIRLVRNPSEAVKTYYVPDVCPAVSLDLGDVCEATDGEAEELAVERARDRLADGGLADSGWANEADDLALYGSAKFADGKELEDPIFDILEAVVILVEDLLGVRDRIVLGRVLSPRYLDTHSQ